MRTGIGTATRADRIEALGLPEEDEERQVETAFATLNRELLPSGPDNKPVDTRVGRLAWKCIYGTDAEPRAARTAKMNMVMHGDGHGGIHYHDGLVDINGIFDGRFDVVLTNPPFGSNVGKDQVLGGSEETRIPTDPAYVAACKKRYGPAWEENHNRLLQLEAEDTSILDLFDIGLGKANRPTELIFVERCLNLLKPGGRMGIVLPDGNLNNPSLSWLRRYAEGRAKLLAVVGLPEETFRSSDATVKASLVFMTKFTNVESAAWDAAWTQAQSELDPTFNAQRDALHGAHGPRITTGDDKAADKLLTKLSKLGVARVLPAWMQGEPPAYPLATGPTQQAKPLWHDTPSANDKDAAVALKREAQTALAAVPKASDALLSELKAKYREVDAAHTAALWARVRELFDYPVFVAAPKAVGITSTGETGEGVTNNLADVLTQFREFQRWIGKGAPVEEQPNFPEPSTA